MFAALLCKLFIGQQRSCAGNKTKKKKKQVRRRVHFIPLDYCWTSPAPGNRKYHHHHHPTI